MNELEEYYRMKTEQVRAEIEAESERKRLLSSQGAIESMDKSHLTSSLRDNQTAFSALQAENHELQAQLDAIMDELERIQQEQLREREDYDQDIAQLQQTIGDTQSTIDSVLENNVSLRFELSTYGRLLHVEEQHMHRMEQQAQNPSPTSTSSALSSLVTPPSSLLSSAAPGGGYQSQPTVERVPSDLATKKMTVQKTARGSACACSSSCNSLLLSVF